MVGLDFNLVNVVYQLDAVQPDQGDYVNLDGTGVVVTGASRGVGRALALALSRIGAKVCCVARSSARHPGRLAGTVDDVVATIRNAGGTAFAVEADLSDLDRVEAAIDRCRGHLGAIDILVNNAAVAMGGSLDIALKRYEVMNRVNLLAPWIAIRSVLPSMRARRSGAIVNVTSAAGLYPYPELMAYGITKLALERLTIDVAVQTQADNIAVNAFRIDIPVDSEGVVKRHGGPSEDAEPPEVAAEGILWVLARESSYTGHLLSMAELRRTHSIMQTRTAKPYSGFVPDRLGMAKGEGLVVGDG